MLHLETSSEKFKKTDNHLKDVMVSCDECDEASQQRDEIIITYIR